MQVQLEKGFKKGNSKNIPTVTEKMFFNYIILLYQIDRKVDPMKCSPPKKVRIDFVQVKKAKPMEVRAIAFTDKEAADNGEIFNVYMKFNATVKNIIEEGCDRCMDSERVELCEHVVAFLLWLNEQQTTKAKLLPFRTFWGSEYETVPKPLTPAEISYLLDNEEIPFDITKNIYEYTESD